MMEEDELQQRLERTGSGMMLRSDAEEIALDLPLANATSLTRQLEQAEAQTAVARAALIDTLAGCFNESSDNVHIQKTDHSIVIYDKSTVTPTNPNAQAIFSAHIDQSSGLMSLNISKLSAHPQLLDKPEMKKFIKGRQFLVKNCDSLASAELLISKFGIGNVVFDDSNPNIAGFKAQLEAKAGIKLTSQPEHAHHVNGPGH